MAKREEKEQDKKEKKKKGGLHIEVKKAVLAIILFALGLVFLLSLWGLAGSVGEYIKRLSESTFGLGSFLAPIILIILASLIIKGRKRLSAILGSVLFLLSFLGLLNVIGLDTGYLGSFVSYPFLNYTGFYVSIVIFIAVLLASFLVVFNVPLSRILSRTPKEEAPKTEEKEEEKSEPVVPPKPTPVPVVGILNRFKKKDREPEVSVATTEDTSWAPLPEDLLDQRQETPASSGNIDQNKKVIKETLSNFGIRVEMGEVKIGPTVTQYTFRPAMGVKLTKITSLQNDLALALAAHPLRIEAPIPGKSLVGIEAPNQKSSIVRLGNILNGNEFKNEKDNLSFVLGKDVGGEAVFASLANMPHLLMAGATGAGKSVGLNVLILSLLYRNSPDDLKLMLIDPKRVELVAYEGVPHLISPVIVDHKKAVEALNWAVHEMEDRFKKLQAAGSRDIASFNKKGKEEKMPYLVIVIDELSDLMSVAAREVEAMVVRLSQMARAVGIHLVISTQRPSVNVITGLIKANIPSRIAFQVATQVDSRTILDMAGAEKLLGSGDMLFFPRDLSKPRRVQGAYVSEGEVRKVVKHIKKTAWQEESENRTSSLNPEPTNQTPPSSPISETKLVNPGVKIDDDMFEEAQDLVIQVGRASASLIQRHLRVGYARAARLLDLLEAKGIVGPHQGSKPRNVLVAKEDSLE
jgi:S-DNA-T family DNA segregation ATPase FtsK/SpoIIIE